MINFCRQYTGVRFLCSKHHESNMAIETLATTFSHCLPLTCIHSRLVRARWKRSHVTLSLASPVSATARHASNHKQRVDMWNIRQLIDAPPTNTFSCMLQASFLHFKLISTHLHSLKALHHWPAVLRTGTCSRTHLKMRTRIQLTLYFSRIARPTQSPWSYANPIRPSNPPNMHTQMPLPRAPLQRSVR